MFKERMFKDVTLPASVPSGGSSLVRLCFLFAATLASGFFSLPFSLFWEDGLGPPERGTVTFSIPAVSVPRGGGPLPPRYRRSRSRGEGDRYLLDTGGGQECYKCGPLEGMFKEGMFKDVTLPASVPSGGSSLVLLCFLFAATLASGLFSLPFCFPFLGRRSWSPGEGDRYLLDTGGGQECYKCGKVGHIARNCRLRWRIRSRGERDRYLLDIGGGHGGQAGGYQGGQHGGCVAGGPGPGSWRRSGRWLHWWLPGRTAAERRQNKALDTPRSSQTAWTTFQKKQHCSSLFPHQSRQLRASTRPMWTPHSTVRYSTAPDTVAIRASQAIRALHPQHLEFRCDFSRYRS
jgi:hypothetical protein